MLRRLRRDGKKTQNCTKKDLSELDNYDGVVSHPEPDIQECEVKWASGNSAISKASVAMEFQ